ncbi:MAG: hypothetical protein FWG81_08115 [Betaproteobacteria bacterium]|nr:hypothetical protein [Betaproteobacteria bacterium]
MRLLLLLFLACPSLANAGCINVAYYSGWLNGEEIEIDISDGGCGDEVMISFWNRSKKESGDSYPFHEECFLTKKGRNVAEIKDYDGYHDGLYCHPKGRTPLAGATYKLIEFGRSANPFATRRCIGEQIHLHQRLWETNRS